jgi:NitT/TauT family transport system ATP-binding protein
MLSIRELIGWMLWVQKPWNIIRVIGRRYDKMVDIVLDQVSFSYGKQQILSQIDLSINAGDFFCLLGPSGSGKSTLLRLISGLVPPSSGSITINGKPMTGPGLDRGVVFQDYSLFPWMSTGANLVLAIQQTHPDQSKRDAKELASEYLELVGLPNAFNRLPSELSGGMRQRAAIARAFAIGSPILLLDEPFGALDPVTRARLQDLLLELWQQDNRLNKTVLFITHDVDEALLLGSRIAVLGLNPGKIKTVQEIDLPRPRQRTDIYRDPRFQPIRKQLVDAMHEDILNQLDAGNISLPMGDRI